jgi:hypothetical protein
MLIGLGGDLPKEAMAHATVCPTCQGFFRDVAALDAATSSLEANLPSGLRSRIRDRIANPRSTFDWRPVAVTVAIVVILTGPIFQVAAGRLTGDYVKGERIGTLPPFHAKLYGKNHMEISGDLTGEIWFSGFAVRMTTPGIDMIDDIEHGIDYQHWRPDGVAEKRIAKWARTGKALTAAERAELLDRFGPVAPSWGTKTSSTAGVAVQVFGREYRTVATTYALPVTKRGGLTSVAVPTDQIVYRDSSTGRIVRVELIATFPGGIHQTETHDYEYTVPSDSKFETTTLQPTPVRVPARQVPPKP